MTALGTGGGWCVPTMSTSSATTAGWYSPYIGVSNATTTGTTPLWIHQQIAQQQFVNSALHQQHADAAPQTRQLWAGEYVLPDGASLIIDTLGNYKVLDEHAKVVYRACRIREFNPYINASDLLEAFINEVGALDGVDQGDVLRLPIEAFINWIILQAAKRDGDPLENLPSVESALGLLK